MATVATLRAKLLMDSSGFHSELTNVTAKMDKAGAKMRSVGKGLMIGVTAPLTAAGAAAAKLAIDAEETASKFNTVLGPAAAAVDAEISKMMTTIPATREQLRAGVADMTMLGKAAGLTADEARELSTEFVSAAADLASFNNVNTDQALEAIRSGLVGSSEPLRAFGIDTREAALQAIALEEGLMKAGDEMDASTRALAVMAAIQRDASDAMGDAARTADSTANIMKFLKRDVMELATSIGEQLIPIIRPMLAQLGEWLERFRTLSPETQKMIVVVAGLAAAAGPLLFVLGTLLTAIAALASPIGVVVVALAGLGAALVTAYMKSETFRKIVNESFRAVSQTVGELIAEVQETIQVWGEWLSLFWEAHGERIMKATEVAFETIASTIKAVLAIVTGTIKTFLNLLQGDWKAAGQNVQAMTDAVWNAIKVHIKLVGDAIIGIVRGMWENIERQFRDKMNAIGRRVEEFKDKTVGAFKKMADLITLGSIWPDMWVSIFQQTQTGTEKVTSVFDGWGSKVLGIFDDLTGGMASKVSGLFGALDEAFGGGFGDLLGKAGGFVKDIGGKLLGGLGLDEGVFGKISGFIGGPWGSAVMGAFDLLGIDIQAWIGDMAKAVGDFIGGIFDSGSKRLEILRKEFGKANVAGMARDIVDLGLSANQMEDVLGRSLTALEREAFGANGAIDNLREAVNLLYEIMIRKGGGGKAVFEDLLNIANQAAERARDVFSDASSALLSGPSLSSPRIHTTPTFHAPSTTTPTLPSTTTSREREVWVTVEPSITLDGDSMVDKLSPKLSDKARLIRI